MELFIIGYGLGGGFGGIQNYEVVEAKDLNEASTLSYEKACEEFEQYAGSYGLRTVEEIMEEEGYEEEEAEQEFNEERESWLDYTSVLYSKEEEEKVSGYHYENNYSHLTDK